MPTLKLIIDDETYCRLADVAVKERRPLPMQAEVLLPQALGRWPLLASDDAGVPSLSGVRKIQHE